MRTYPICIETAGMQVNKIEIFDHNSFVFFALHLLLIFWYTATKDCQKRTLKQLAIAMPAAIAITIDDDE